MLSFVYGMLIVAVTVTIAAMQLLNHTRSVAIFSLVIRNCCLLFRAARQLFKLQLEVCPWSCDLGSCYIVFTGVFEQAN